MRVYSQTVPENVHPVVRRLFVEMNAQRVSRHTLSAWSGVTASSISRWRAGVGPDIPNIEACLNALGLDLVVEVVS